MCRSVICLTHSMKQYVWGQEIIAIGIVDNSGHSQNQEKHDPTVYPTCKQNKKTLWVTLNCRGNNSPNNRIMNDKSPKFSTPFYPPQWTSFGRILEEICQLSRQQGLNVPRKADIRIEKALERGRPRQESVGWGSSGYRFEWQTMLVKQRDNRWRRP